MGEGTQRFIVTDSMCGTILKVFHHTHMKKTISNLSKNCIVMFFFSVKFWTLKLYRIFLNSKLSSGLYKAQINQLLSRQAAIPLTKKHLIKSSYFPLLLASTSVQSLFIHPSPSPWGNHSWSLLSSPPHTFNSPFPFVHFPPPPTLSFWGRLENPQSGSYPSTSRPDQF